MKDLIGSGQLYSRGQLLDLLRQTNFSVSNIQETLYFLPSQKALERFISAGYEPLARNLLPYFGGVLICNAQKRLFQGLLAHRRQSRHVFIPALTPQMTNRKSFGRIDVVK